MPLCFIKTTDLKTTFLEILLLFIKNKHFFFLHFFLSPKLIITGFAELCYEHASLPYTFTPRNFSTGKGRLLPFSRLYIDSDPPAFIGLSNLKSICQQLEKPFIKYKYWLEFTSKILWFMFIGIFKIISFQSKYCIPILHSFISLAEKGFPFANILRTFYERKG